MITAHCTAAKNIHLLALHLNAFPTDCVKENKSIFILHVTEQLSHELCDISGFGVKIDKLRLNRNAFICFIVDYIIIFNIIFLHIYTYKNSRI